MTDVSLPYRGSDTRFWPLRHFAEIATFAIILMITIRLPEIGKFMTLGWVGVLGLLILTQRYTVGRMLRWSLVLLAPFLAVLSYFWSEAPTVTARYGLQLFITAFAGILIARSLSPSRFLTVLFLAMLVFCVLSVASGRSSMGVLIGLVGSKNQMSFMAYVLVFSGLAVMVDPNSPRVVRLLTLPAMALGTYLVATTASATAYLMTAASIIMFIGLSTLNRLRPAGRLGLILAFVVLASPIALVIPEINQAINDFLINVLHKDPGLTGRDYLWERAADLIARKPALGLGFQAFWMGGSQEAESLLLAYGQRDGRVFNFHNTYLQFAVDTGLIGATVLVLTIGAALYGYARRYVVAPTVATSFMFTLFALSVGRTFTEVLLVPFSSPTLLFYICIGYAFWRPLADWGGEDARGRAAAPVYPYPIPPGSPYPVSLQRMRTGVEPGFPQA